jgi:uroporphyrinogen-III decarboxylase
VSNQAEQPITPYQRCLATIEGQAVDRLPAYTPTIASDVASKILGRPVDTGGPALWYAEAKAWADGPDAFAAFEARYVEGLIDLNRALDIEVIRYGYRKHIHPSKQLDEHRFLVGDPEGIYQIWRWDPEVLNFLKVKDSAPQPKPEDWPMLAREQIEATKAQVSKARESAGTWEAALQERLGAEMMVVAGGGGLSIGHSEPSLMASILEPEAVGDILDSQLQVGLAQMEGIAKRGIKVVLGGGDMADKNGPMYSPDTFRQLILPRLKVLSARCQELGLHYVWRTDGKIWSVSDMIFEEAAVPGYGEVDYEAGMTTPEIRERYPDLVIWANVSSDVLRWGSREEAYRHCLALLEASDGRCYFHGCSNTVMPGTPPENVWAMMEARDDYVN